MKARTLAIGDTHGCTQALKALVGVLSLTSDDTLITLGDYVGKGDDSKGTLDYLISLQNRCKLVPLLGNHDFLMRSVLRGDLSLGAWLSLGGQKVLDSYGIDSEIATIPKSHRLFLEQCQLFYETASHIFIHACYQPDLQLAETDEYTILWQRLTEEIPLPHYTGKIAVVGHTSQNSGKILDASHLLCIDTACVTGGRLTAIDTTAKMYWSVDCRGNSIEKSPIV